MTPLRTFAIAALSFFLSTVSPFNYTAFGGRLEAILLFITQEKEILEDVDFGFGERERFFCLFSPSIIITPPTKKLHKNQIIHLYCQQRKKERDLSLHSLSLSLSLSLLHLFFFVFFFKNVSSSSSFLKRKGGDTQKNAPPQIPLHFLFVIHPSIHPSSSIIAGARSEIAMGGADVMTFVRSTRPGFPEGLKVRLFFFLSLSSF